MVVHSSPVARGVLFGLVLGVVGFASEARAEERRSWCCPDVALAPATFPRSESTFSAVEEIVVPWRERTVLSAGPWLDGSDVVAVEPYPEATSTRRARSSSAHWLPTDATLTEPWL